MTGILLTLAAGQGAQLIPSAVPLAMLSTAARPETVVGVVRDGDQCFAEYRESSTDFDAHKAILAVATTLLGAAPAALALVKTTIEALQSMDSTTPWLTIFSRESQTSRAARFQMAHDLLRTV